MSGQSKDVSEDRNFERHEEPVDVDPRVQIELEKLNAATDDINKLEVDLDEARAEFRQLLCDSSVRINALAKKLGSCVEKSRPYYEARIKAKEALHETQLAAVRFERANSAHAAAKEMVYLAEEGLCAEGRTFDHAWQEMLNHATMRVNESELERTISEAEHRRTSHCYQRAETNVQQLQKELKRSIAKSSLNIVRALSHCNRLEAILYMNVLPYFELKAQFNQILEEQKSRVKKLERRVGIAKASYAEALRNLEQISDEIHRIRKHGNEGQLGTRGSGVGAESPLAVPAVPSLDTRNTSAATLSSSTNADTDRWTDTTESSDSECGEEYLRLPEKLGPSGSPIIPKGSHDETSEKSEYLSLSGLSDAKHKSQNSHTSQNTQHPNIIAPGSQHSTMETSFIQQNQAQASRSYSLFSDSKSKNEKKHADSPEEENMIQSLFSKIVPAKLRQGSSSTYQNSPKTSAKCENTDQETIVNTPPVRHSFLDEQATLSDEISSRDIGNAETWSEVSLTSNKTSPESERIAGKSEVWTEVNLNDSSSPVSDLGDDTESRFTSADETQSTPIRLKLDSSLSNWITRSSVDQGNNSRRQSLDTLILGGLATGERVKEILSQGIMKLNISSLTERRSSEPKVDKPGVRMNLSGVPVLSATKKVPSPLEKSMNYLNPEDDSTSDSESLASVEMLTDEQISSLMLEQDLQEVCQQVLGTPISEIAPYFTSSEVTQ